MKAAGVLQVLERMEPCQLERLLDRLQELAAAAREALSRKQGGGEFELPFEATADPRKGAPYVARLTVQDGRLHREFVNLNRTVGRKEVTVWGTYRARAGEVLEIRTGGWWKNDYRAWYLVTPQGKLVEVAGIGDSGRKMLVERYLRGEANAEELLENA